MTTLFQRLMLLALPLIGACSSLGHHDSPAEPPTEADLAALAIFDGHTGERATWDDLHAAIDDADLVVLGELHGHPVGLPFDAKLFRESLELLERTLGEQHHETTEARVGLADALWFEARYEDAAALFEEALGWYTERGAADSRAAWICRLRLAEMRCFFGSEQTRAAARAEFASLQRQLAAKLPAQRELIELAERAAARIASQ